MTDKELRTIKTIAEAGSIEKAAARLQKNPSSLSRMVHRVEDDLDIILFTRTPEGLKPTAEGEIYLETARKILELYDGLYFPKMKIF